MWKRLFKYPTICVLAATMLAGCGEYQRVEKVSDIEYKYEVAKAYYMDGHYGRASLLLGDVLAALKATPNGEESLYMLAMCSYQTRDYESAASYFKKYYQSYPKGEFVEHARYYAGMSLYNQTPDTRLDQTVTEEAINELQSFLDLYPTTRLKDATQDIIYKLQDKMVYKEYLAAQMYFDLGTYMGNSLYGGSNYEACVVTAQNALKDYPFALPERREDLSILILRAKYHLALESVEEKRVERFRNAIDEYYAFENDYPESKYMAEAKTMLSHAERVVKRKHINLAEEDAD
ncbi:MAG: outer membrane protein assembly factor BamD [Bacteroidaceae bacterium]